MAVSSRQFSLVLVVVSLGWCAMVSGQGADVPGVRAKAQKNMRDGNWKDAYEGFRKICLEKENTGPEVAQDLQNAVNCLQRLGLLKDVDELIESTVDVQQRNWRLLQQAASIYLSIQHQGYMISGKFERGPHRGGGKVMHAFERDRTRALQLMQQAIPLTREEDNKADVSSFYQNLANQLLSNRGYSESWRLQYKSDLDELPDYEEGWGYYRNWTGAPVGKDGLPVFHKVGKSWQDSKTDGERWRWCLEQVVEYNPSRLNTVRGQMAQFAWQQFGVQTMQQYNWARPYFGAPQQDDGSEDESGTYALHTLTESETIAKLATGIKRFDLPDDYNFLKIWKTIADEPATGGGENALNQLAQIFENRRQYPKAAEYWNKSIDQYGPGRREYKRKRVQQIVDNWGRFEGVQTQAADEKATVEYRFRNGKNIKLTAHSIKVAKLLSDVKDYLKSDPGRITDYQKINIANIGYRLVTKGEGQYIGDEVASWEMELKPRKDHFDKRVTVKTPLSRAGAYLVTAVMEGGNTSKIILWLADTAIVEKRLSESNLYYVADAESGRPVDGATLDFFGWKQTHLGGRRFKIDWTAFAERTNKDGQVVPDRRDLKTGYQWLVTASGVEDRLAYMGFRGVWYSRYYDQEYNTVKVFTITDRPVYRPDQTVHFKLWVRHAQYDNEGSQFAGKSFPVEIFNPKNEKVYSQTLETDEFGGIVGSFEVPEDATLGVYRLNIQVRDEKRLWASGGNTFRVEEYKKPEYEVTIDAPTEPVMLGEKITAKINARYYFGSPVTHATVKYKVTRQDYSQNWFPIMPWDWCYGPGYWWFCYDYPWYPGWNDWVGCRRPVPWWWHRGRSQPPEVVAEQEVEIGEDGTVDVEIDTLLAKELHGNQDHEYTITAEVRDQSRRTIVGTGKVLVARKPFEVFTWVDRGYYRVGDTIRADFKAQTLDDKPVEGKGVLTLLKITYDNENQPIETPVRQWKVDTNPDGIAHQLIHASAKGQYRLSYKLTDSKDHEIEGGYLFTIIGDGFDGKGYRFNNIELIPEKSSYQPGETVKLQINTDRADTTVLLFVRPANGIYLPPKTIHLEGKSTVYKLDVIKKDMPNFFVEGLTVADGKVYADTKEIVVPPEKRVLNVAVLPSDEAYKPGEKAKVKIRLTDFTGENFQGSIVASIYDKSVEYISGGSNVPDIKEFFWKWRRRHNPSQATSLARFFNNLTLPGQDAMSFIGVFGATVADEFDAMADDGEQMEMANAGAEVATARRGQRMALAKSAPAPGATNGIAMAAVSQDKAGIGGGGAAVPADASRKANAGDVATPKLVEPTVRTKFADTAKWIGKLETDKTGVAEIELEMPENLTTWKIKVWGMGQGTKVGSGETEVVTRKDLIIRLQAPRFFVQKDEVVLSANVHNYLKSEKEVTVSLELPTGQLKPMDGVQPTVKVKVPAGGESRVDWRVDVVEEGLATIRMKALTDEESDAMEVKLPCFVHGMLKTESWAGTVRPEDETSKVTINVPSQRRVEQSVLEVRYSPTLAGAMVDALPYLADYPYGCTEQTLNRFLPTVITQKVLLDMGLDLAAIKEKRTNLNAQEIGDDTERAKQWKRYDRNPVFDQAELDRMVKDGLKRLTSMQVSDGGWGWFSGFGERSYPHTTAVVVHGLQIARHNDVAIVPGVLENGVAWLNSYQKKQVALIRNAETKTIPYKSSADNLDAFVYMILVDEDIDNKEMQGYLYRDRNNLSVYAKAMFGLALQTLGKGEELAMIRKNIEQFLVTDTENETAYLNVPENTYWWYWYGSEIEANAYYLKLLSRIDAAGKTAPRLVKYLLNNRKHATYWRSTRDTAICVEAFADYIRASGEDKPDMTVQVLVDSQVKKEVKINAENLFSFDNKLVLTGADVKNGEHVVELRRQGKGPVYFNAYLTNFTLEDFITKAGLEVKVTRKYYKLKPVDKTIKVEGSRGQALDQKVEKYERIELENLAELKSGDLVEVELSIESKNDYEYMIFEDMKPAGFEAVEVRSGYTNEGLRAYTEYRDDRVAFFIQRLARGNHSVAYRLRAEIPGRFSALPARASAMYAPELKGNSDEIKLSVED